MIQVMSIELHRGNNFVRGVNGYLDAHLGAINPIRSPISFSVDKADGVLVKLIDREESRFGQAQIFRLVSQGKANSTDWTIMRVENESAFDTPIFQYGSKCVNAGEVIKNRCH